MKNLINGDDKIDNKDLKRVKTKIWIKTLLCSYKVFPRLINTIDKIIELQASNLSFSSSIFNSSSRFENQYEQVINMSERKKSLVNIHIMITKMINDMPYDIKKLIEYRFVDNMTVDDIAVELELSERTVYRKYQKLLNEIYDYFCKQNWSLKFIECQVQDEDWLFDKFNLFYKEYIENQKEKIS